MKTYIARIIGDNNVRYEFSVSAPDEEGAAHRALLEFLKAVEYRELMNDSDEAIMAIVEKGKPFTAEDTCFYNIEAYLDISHSVEQVLDDEIDDKECHKLIDEWV